ncbi:type II toxin-antitoxin system PemK/MazF family toxin [Staphylococcus simiae]|uniref:Endoribonuclease MazF n=1 Tax=Staphylococcus simiae CCM 7213 = CCUG 51256 TaxID=911238 RepID=G5JI95_9STAP|nr:type II toxin-antitoxin system PemK/MazF family toxin [Staphylococcus simiae]EHJ08088.1 hypothetical protein SS7213T_05906 [Staphylococcus simiae CCM 7213 = CCUG 51256]PNZ09834.1 growth inhibitor PemK [Staphylococcus simiae]SNV75571.1 Phage protein [Staphylococcus simiae]
MTDLDFNKKEKAYKSFLNSTTKLIDTFNKANKKNRKIKYLPEWIDFYASHLLEENSYSTNRRYSVYKKGTIVYVNLGSNIGKEFSGNHFCIVLDNKDNPNKETITVIPLSSKQSKHYIQLESSILDITIIKLNKEVDQLYKEADNLKNMANDIMNKHEATIKEKASRNMLLYKYGYITEHYMNKLYYEIENLIKDEAEAYKNNINYMIKRAKNMKVVETVFQKHKDKQSYANVSAITSISKKRIQKINDEDPTGKIQINEKDLEKIEKQILIRFIKKLK